MVAVQECKPFGLSSKEAVWRNNTMVWLREALAELHGSSTLPPMPEADENVPLAQVWALDKGSWLEGRERGCCGAEEGRTGCACVRTKGQGQNLCLHRGCGNGK